MLKDADPKNFHAIYVVCGFTDLRYGMDRLAAIIEHQYHLDVFVPNTLFLFCGRRANRIKGLLWEGDGSGRPHFSPKVTDFRRFWYKNPIRKEVPQEELNRMDKNVIITLFLSQQKQLSAVSSQLEFLSFQIVLMNQRAFGRKTEKLDQIAGQMMRIYDYLELLLTELPKHADDTSRDFLPHLLPWSEFVQEKCGVKKKSK